MTIAVSSWALHRSLGVSFPDSPATGPTEVKRHNEPSLALRDLPAALRDHGFLAAELCHFHLPIKSAEDCYEIRDSFEASGVRIQTLLIDDGDLSDGEHAGRDADWIAKWIEYAAALGAERARVIAGKQAFGEEAFGRALGHLDHLARYAIAKGLRLTTENWFPLLANPDAVNRLLDATKGRIGLCADFGNWEPPRKYADLPKILPRAETCHAKCEFRDGSTLDEDDYAQCLALARAAQFDGPYVLVNGGPVEDWSALELSRSAILSA